jgi:hypothetical protein
MKIWSFIQENSSYDKSGNLNWVNRPLETQLVSGHEIDSKRLNRQGSKKYLCKRYIKDPESRFLKFWVQHLQVLFRTDLASIRIS